MVGGLDMLHLLPDDVLVLEVGDNARDALGCAFGFPRNFRDERIRLSVFLCEEEKPVAHRALHVLYAPQAVVSHLLYGALFLL